MGDALVPGNLNPGNGTDYSLFVNSMAAEIENQLSLLMTNDGLPPLSMDLSDQSVRDRRRLFVAIARGVVLHLAANEDAFVIGTNNTTVAQLTQIKTA